MACQEDPYGNYILYNYQQDIENADIWLKSIEYTFNNSCNYTQTNRIDFLYNRVKDVPTGFLNGFRIKRDKILKEISVFAGSEQVRTYKMKYIKDEKDIYPKLNSIQEFGKNNVAYNPIIIGWGNHQGEKCLQKYAFEHRPTDVIQGDFNGDGIEDFLTIDKQYIMRPPEYMDSINIVLEVQTIDKKGNREKVWTTTIYDQNYSFTVIPGDFNGDGLLDLAMLTKDDTHFTIMKAYLNEEGKLGYKTTTRLGGVASPVLVGHFEGNRKDQLLIGNKYYSFDDELVKYTSLNIETLPR
ncbi:VCBS repeat-containing protein [Bacteroides sp. BFG-551]|nr:VCBS repeat-containing protein [Bacteroides sp. BFG-551]